MTTNHMKAKVIAKLIQWGNNHKEVSEIVESNFESAVSYGYKTPSKIADYIRTVA